MKFNPPRHPKKLPGTLWGITTFFNPAGYSSKIRNYRIFRESLKRQGLKLLAVELAFEDSPFELGDDDADIVVRMRGGKSNALFQKEAMLNVALKNLPADCDKVVWIDADVIFRNDRWVKQTSKLLESYEVVQPFSRTARLPRGAGAEARAEDFPPGNDDGKQLHGMAYGICNFGKETLRSFDEHGHCGFAWAARRSVYETLGFYDRLILGSADLVMAHGFYDGGPQCCQRFPEKMAKDHLAWTSKAFAFVGGSVFYTEGMILHLWHGTQKNRFYSLRHLLLFKHDFDPNADVRLAPGGYLEWSTSNQELRDGVEHYFQIRNEDGRMFGDAWAKLHAAADSLLRIFEKEDISAKRLEKRNRGSFGNGNKISSIFSSLKFRLWERLDYLAGQAGVLLKKISPSLYSFLKRRVSSKE